MHWFSPSQNGYVFTFAPGSEVHVQSLLAPKSRVVGAHPSGSPCIACGEQWSVLSGSEFSASGRSAGFAVTSVFFKADGEVLAQCGHKQICIGGNIVHRELSHCASDGTHVAGITPDSVVALREAGDIAIVVRAGATAVDIGSGKIIYAVWNCNAAGLEFCDVAQLHWLPASSSHPRKKKRSSSMEDVLQCMCVGEQRLWAVRVLAGGSAALYGGNDWKVSCVSLESHNVLWSVGVENVVLCLSSNVSGDASGVAVATADSIAWLDLCDRSLEPVPHSSIQTPGLQLCEGHFLEEDGGGRRRFVVFFVRPDLPKRSRGRILYERLPDQFRRAGAPAPAGHL